MTLTVDVLSVPGSNTSDNHFFIQYLYTQNSTEQKIYHPKEKSCENQSHSEIKDQGNTFVRENDVRDAALKKNLKTVDP